MSLKRLAMLSALSYHNQHNNDNNYNNSNAIYKNNEINYNKTQTLITTSETLESTTKIVNSNKSTLIQLKHPQQQLSQNTTTPTIQRNTTTTTLTSSSSIIPFLAQPLYNDKATTISTTIALKNNHQSKSGESDDTTLATNDDSSNYSGESNESIDLNHQTTPERHPPNTYTGTTYYGSGFGVFHQQNMRSNGGGGIALITGSSSSNGLSGGSYTNGINNNVNLLLGGAMLTLITTILCVVCYCCHRNIKKRTEAAYRQQRQWLENDPNMEIYSVEQCYETSGLFVGDSMDGLATIPALHHEPPPSYDAVVAMQEQQQVFMQQHQQQLMMQQQLLQQQLPANNSPPPGYRSALDVNSVMQQGRGIGLGGVLSVGGSIMSGMEINSLASSTANIRISTSISPIDPLLNYNDVNGNVESAAAGSTIATNNNPTVACFLRNKQQQQQVQRNVPAAPNQMNQLNMKKVLQAQSCCSLQRAEVENMWNAAAAALAARSVHLANDSRASTAVSTSSPTLVMTTRIHSPETFGNRYLKQNYYKSGCPLCGKFRYDNESTLSTSTESNLDTLAGALAEAPAGNAQEMILETTQNNLNNNENLTKTLDNRHLEEEKTYEELECNDDDDDDDGDLEDEANDNYKQIEQPCSCWNSKRKNELKLKSTNYFQNINTQQNLELTEVQQSIATNESELRNEAAFTAADDNVICAFETNSQLTNQAASNNNNDITDRADTMNLPSTSAATDTTIPRSPVPAASTTLLASTPSVAINLDCINENGIISLDMSKIIDKTGLPTYDAALKLESSGYV